MLATTEAFKALLVAFIEDVLIVPVAIEGELPEPLTVQHITILPLSHLIEQRYESKRYDELDDAYYMSTCKAVHESFSIKAVGCFDSVDLLSKLQCALETDYNSFVAGHDFALNKVGLVSVDSAIVPLYSRPNAKKLESAALDVTFGYALDCGEIEIYGIETITIQPCNPDSDPITVTTP